MAIDQPKQIVEIRDFAGLVLSVDPHRIVPGAAQDQVNCMAIDEGRLQVRGGMRTVSYEWSTVE